MKGWTLNILLCTWKHSVTTIEGGRPQLIAERVDLTAVVLTRGGKEQRLRFVRLWKGRGHRLEYSKPNHIINGS